MATDFNQFPIGDPLIKEGSAYMSQQWIVAMSSFYQNIISFLTQTGIFLPPLTTSDRDSIQAPQNGQMIYNTTLGSAQYFKAGVWTSF